jgi:hypothetical protein
MFHFTEVVARETRRNGNLNQKNKKKRKEI